MTTWDEIVAAATVGTDTRPFTISGLPGPASAHSGVLAADEPAAAVLDAAALLAAARRAGRVLESAPAPERLPAAPDTAPELTPVGASILARRVAANDQSLVATLLMSTAEAGRRLPPPLLPAVLEAATRDRVLRSAVVPVLGRRGVWLAAHRTEWEWAADDPTTVEDPQVWETGGRAARLAHLVALRERDPAGARERLAASWAGESGDEREAFVEALAAGLSLADEPFLEAALDDRKQSVRSAAIRLLATLEGSTFQARAVARAAGLLQVRRTVLGRRLVASPPGEWDTAAHRDGLTHDPPPGTGIGASAWWLVQFVGAAPLATWQALGADAEQLPVDDGYAAEVHAGWRRAAARERDQRWLSALLAAPPDVGARPTAFRARVWVPDFSLMLALPRAVLASTVTELVGRAGEAVPFAELMACPTPWPAPLAQAVLRRLAAASTQAHQIAPGVREVLRAAGVGLPVEAAEQVEQLAARALPATTWPFVLRSLAATVSIRRTFARELAS